jgi:hypothetical protein
VPAKENSDPSRTNDLHFFHHKKSGSAVS